MKRLFAIIGILLLTACGGGGSGGAPAPANLNSGNNNNGGNTGGNNGGNTGELKTGIFSDAPVAGLGFVQGSHQGVTDANGTFSYYSGSSHPVLFRIGTVELGAAMGADVVTPVDLAIEGKPVGRDGAVNMARVLITLDTDQNPDNGIALPDSVLAAAGNLPFTLNTQAFTEEAAVERFVEKYAEGRSLVSSTVARNHLLENPQIKSWFDNDNAVVKAVIDNVDIAWNSNLRESGVLATFKANNKERLHVVVSGTDDLRLSILVYIDQNNRYLTVAFGSDGNISHVDVNGTIEKIIVMRPLDPLATIDFTHYTPTLEAVRMGVDGIAAAKPMASLQPANMALIKAILTRVQESDAQARDMVVLGTELLAVVDSVLCAGKTPCDSTSLLQKSLQLALNDATYYRNTLHFADINLNQNECISVAAVSAQAPCAGSVPLTHLVALLMNNRSAIESVHSDGMIMKEIWVSNNPTSGEGLGDNGMSSHWRFVQREFSEEFLSSSTPNESNYEKTPVRVAPWLEVAVPVKLRLEVKRLPDQRAFFSVSVVNMKVADMTYMLCEQDDEPESDGYYDGAHCKKLAGPRNSSDVAIGELLVQMKDVYFPSSGIWQPSSYTDGKATQWFYPVDSKAYYAMDNQSTVFNAALAEAGQHSAIYIDRLRPIPSSSNYEYLAMADFALAGIAHITHPGIPGGGWIVAGVNVNRPFYP